MSEYFWPKTTTAPRHRISEPVIEFASLAIDHTEDLMIAPVTIIVTKANLSYGAAMNTLFSRFCGEFVL